MQSKLVAAIVMTAAGAMLVWAGEKFQDLPQDVNTLKIERIEDSARMQRFENKLDKQDDKLNEILSRLPRRNQ